MILSVFLPHNPSTIDIPPLLLYVQFTQLLRDGHFALRSPSLLVHFRPSMASHSFLRISPAVVRSMAYSFSPSPIMLCLAGVCLSWKSRMTISQTSSLSTPHPPIRP